MSCPFYRGTPFDYNDVNPLFRLNFGTNQLTILPDDIGVLVNLEVLILSNNALGVSSGI